MRLYFALGALRWRARWARDFNGFFFCEFFAQTCSPSNLTASCKEITQLVLASLPKSEVTAEQAVERAQLESRNGQTAVVIDTDAFTGLNPGYWAVVVPGADSRSASNEVCRALGMAVNDKCYPREIKG